MSDIIGPPPQMVAGLTPRYFFELFPVSFLSGAALSDFDVWRCVADSLPFLLSESLPPALVVLAIPLLPVCRRHLSMSPGSGWFPYQASQLYSMSGTSPLTKSVVGSPYSPSVGLASRLQAITRHACRPRRALCGWPVPRSAAPSDQMRAEARLPRRGQRP